jgi:hypothetical protein
VLTLGKSCVKVTGIECFLSVQDFNALRSPSVSYDPFVSIQMAYFLSGTPPR